MFKLGSSAPPWQSSIHIYIIPALQNAAESVARQVAKDKTGKDKVHVVIMPKALHLIQSTFESLGALDAATLHSLAFDFIPLDRNLLSLEMPQFLSTSFVHGDGSLLSSVAKGLLSLEVLIGAFPCVVTLGEKAHKVHNLLEAWRSEIRPSCPADSEFTHLILMDRSADFASVLLTQLTYEGVLDDTFRMRSGFVQLDEQTRLMMNSTKDEIYAEIRGKHISSVFQLLSAKAKELQSIEGRKDAASTVEEMKHYVANDLKRIQTQKKSLAQHIDACELVMKRQQAGLLEEQLAVQQQVISGDGSREQCLAFLEDCCARGCDLNAVLRHACLQSLTLDGLPDKDFHRLHKQILQAFGYRHLATIHRLQRLGLLVQRDSAALKLPGLPELLPDKLRLVPGAAERPAGFRKTCQRLNLLPTDDSWTGESVKTGQHPSYVFNGVYTPLVYHLVER